MSEDSLATIKFEKDIAEAVIRPKLQRVVRKYEITCKADLRKWFLVEEGITLSAAKFDEYLKLLGVTFKKEVVIEGLFGEGSKVGSLHTAIPPRPEAGEETADDDFKFDNETPKDTRVTNRDVFGLA